MSGVQSILFQRRYWTEARAREWLAKHDMHSRKKVHITEDTLRFRQEEPELFDHFRTKKITPTITYIIGFRAKKKPRAPRKRQ